MHEELVPVAARWIEPDRREGPLVAYARDAAARTLDLLEVALVVAMVVLAAGLLGWFGWLPGVIR